MLTAALPLGRPLWLREPRCFARIRRRVIAPVACVALGWWLRSQSFPSRHEGQGRNRPTTKASETTQRSPRRRQPSGKAAVSQLRLPSRSISPQTEARMTDSVSF